jgi:alcohol dehydrogenase class IV
VNFDFVSVSRIVFGRSSFNRIGDIAAEFGRSALIVTNADRSGKQGLIKRLSDLLAAKTIKSTTLWIDGEPTVDDIDKGTSAARAAGADVLIGLGGGSAMDAAKAIAALVTNGGAAIDYMEVIGKGQKVTRPGVPLITAPTTAGTGAEVTRNAVIGCPEKQFKASIRSEHLLPRAAIVDAELGVAVRPEVTARTGMDALTQLIEAYTAKGAQPITDALALQGIRHAAHALRRAYKNGSDLDAREDMALAALLSGIALTNAGLGAVHGFAAPMGARYPVPHGTVCAALLPGVMGANISALEKTPDHPVLKRYAGVGRLLAANSTEGDSQNLKMSDAEARQAGVSFVKALVKEFEIPKLSTYGLAEAHVPEMVTLAQKANSMRYNPVALSEQALSEVLRTAL